MRARFGVEIFLTVTLHRIVQSTMAGRTSACVNEVIHTDMAFFTFFLFLNGPLIMCFETARVHNHGSAWFQHKDDTSSARVVEENSSCYNNLLQM